MKWRIRTLQQIFRMERCAYMVSESNWHPSLDIQPNILLLLGGVHSFLDCQFWVKIAIAILDFLVLPDTTWPESIVIYEVVIS